MTWNGCLVMGGAKSSETQFAYLMQMLLHNGKNGVSRGQLEQVLFGDRDISDLHHSTRAAIYNAKKKLRVAGLPKVNYIEQRDGVYYWTDSIRVVEDAKEMERLFLKAEEEQDPKEALELYLNACHYYTGEFLASQAGVVWVAREARRYRALFCACVNKAVSLLRDRQEYFRMEELGLYAAKINPLADWETVTMEALVSMGRYEDARKLYDDTVEMYFLEQGLHPSKRLMEILNRLGGQMEHRRAVLDDIQEKLSEEGESMSGGYFCSYPVFQGIYHMVKRIMERGGQSVYLMLCTVVDSKGNPMKDGPALEELSLRLGDAICSSVRHSDAVNRYGKGQYLVLLINTTRENCGVIQKRIECNFIVRRQRTGLQYYVNSVLCSPEDERIIMDKEKK